MELLAVLDDAQFTARTASFTGTAGSTDPWPAGPQGVVVWTTTAAYIRVGSDATATTADMPIPANTQFLLKYLPALARRGASVQFKCRLAAPCTPSQSTFDNGAFMPFLEYLCVTASRWGWVLLSALVLPRQLRRLPQQILQCCRHLARQLILSQEIY